MTAHAPTVSVLVPTYNMGRYLAELCLSIQAQTFADFEAIVLDDGSTDDTPQVLAPFRGDPRFCLLTAARNRGLGASFKWLLQTVRGRYWCSPGADDILEPDFLRRRVAAMEACPEACLVHGEAAYINQAGERITPEIEPIRPPEYLEGEDALRVLVQHNIIIQPSTLVRTSVTKTLLGDFLPNWRFAPDWFLWILHAATDHVMLYQPGPLMRYRVHTGSLSQTPALAGLRAAEIRLVTLCALGVAARYSEPATRLWLRQRQALYALWLRRAWVVRRTGALSEGHLALGAAAFHGWTVGRVSLAGQLLRHSGAILRYSWRETAARRRQKFLVSGLAQINHALFLK